MQKVHNGAHSGVALSFRPGKDRVSHWMDGCWKPRLPRVRQGEHIIAGQIVNS
jgi:hypothetical protein